MNNVIYGNKNYYGVDLGIIMLDSTFPRIVGDVGNALTWDFPVTFKKVECCTPKKAVFELSKSDLEPFIAAARELEAEGVRIIITSCGFLSLFQEELADSVSVPVVTSALLVVPLVQHLLGKNGKLGILTANSNTLSSKHLESVGIINQENIVIYGLQEGEMFTNFTVENWNYVDVNKCKEELLFVAKKMINENNNIKAIVLECTNMPPYSRCIQETTNVPVFDIVSLVNMIHDSIKHKNFLI